MSICRNGGNLNHTLVRFGAVSDIYQASVFVQRLGHKGFLFLSFWGWGVVKGGVWWSSAADGNLRKKGKEGLVACCLLCCTAAVSAGMAPLTICSLIANIRVHFLGHWSGTERWWAELWAFLSLLLLLCLSSLCSLCC